jgi:hypothetical protein
MQAIEIACYRFPLLVHKLQKSNHSTQKPKTNLTADYADYTDTIGYKYKRPEVLPRK